MDEKIIFWGIGKIGARILSFAEQYGIKPDYLCDNNPDLWGKNINNIKVLSPKEVYEIDAGIKIYITCLHYADVMRQLLDQGISYADIYIADSLNSVDVCRLILSKKINYFKKNTVTYDFFIDLAGGKVLGGVERWSYDLAENLKKEGFSGAYICPNINLDMVPDDNFETLTFDLKKESAVLECAKIVLKYNPRVVICNFPSNILYAVCVLKEVMKLETKLLAVIHNDEDIYYKSYPACKKFVDCYMAISTKTLERLVGLGISRQQIDILYWNIKIPDNYEKKYSSWNEPLRIGYAGRIRIIQKRCDRLIEIAKRLKQKNVKFILQIAGSGDFEQDLLREIQTNDLSNEIQCLGLVQHEDIYDFWREQDVYINCSEWEGHSITQCEAMACGVVPVVMDVSGSEDDIENGETGYIVNQGDIDSQVELIEQLASDRSQLSLMGKKASQVYKKWSAGYERNWSFFKNLVL